MSAINFNTRNDTYRKLMGNGLIYCIPRFQRDYSWTEEEWEDLWLDILGVLKEGGEPAHYLGYLVLQSNNERNFDVIDGQQRLTTLSVIVLAVLKNLQRLVATGIDAERNKARLDQIRQTYIGYLDPVTLNSRSKLTLNRNNDHYYQTYLVPLGPLPQRGFRASEHSLRKAFEWYDKRIGDYVRRSAQGDEGVVLARFVEDVSDRLFFTVITVTDELNAYKVFETLNARGVRLSATDLLKNHLFSVLHREGQHAYEMEVLEKRWENMVGRLGSESFPDFLRTHWNSRHPFLRQTELFKEIRRQVGTREAVFALIREMEADLDTYLALSQPDASHWLLAWKDFANDLRMFNVRQPFPLLLAARHYFSDADFSTVLRACVIASFRYNVIGNLPANEQERVYNSVAEKISRHELTTVTAVLRAMDSIYPRDEEFHTAFAYKSIRTNQSRSRRIVRYVLCALEKRLSGLDCDFGSADFNLEHVLPENPAAGQWQQFSDEDVESMAFRLGNLTVMKASENAGIGNLEYEHKRPIYLRSSFELTNKLATENDEWTPERVEVRQHWMAKQAKVIWRVEQLS